MFKASVQEGRLNRDGVLGYCFCSARWGRPRGATLADCRCDCSVWQRWLGGCGWCSEACWGALSVAALTCGAQFERWPSRGRFEFSDRGSCHDVYPLSRYAGACSLKAPTSWQMIPTTRILPPHAAHRTCGLGSGESWGA